MELESQVGRDHPVDLKRLLNSEGSSTYEHLLTFVAVEIRGGKARICFLGRSDVNIVREGARNPLPAGSPNRIAGRYSNLAMTLRPGELVRVGPGLLDLRLIAAGGGKIKIRASMLSRGLLLNTEPLGDQQELNIRGMIERLNRGQDYRCSAL
jgi:hypothetical protein